jgi:hypothetical protein
VSITSAATTSNDSSSAITTTTTTSVTTTASASASGQSENQVKKRQHGQPAKPTHLKYYEKPTQDFLVLVRMHYECHLYRLGFFPSNREKEAFTNKSWALATETWCALPDKHGKASKVPVTVDTNIRKLVSVFHTQEHPYNLQIGCFCWHRSSWCSESCCLCCSRFSV